MGERRATQRKLSRSSGTEPPFTCWRPLDNRGNGTEALYVEQNAPNEDFSDKPRVERQTTM